MKFFFMILCLARSRSKNDPKGEQGQKKAEHLAIADKMFGSVPLRGRFQNFSRV